MNQAIVVNTEYPVENEVASTGMCDLPCSDGSQCDNSFGRPYGCYTCYKGLAQYT